MAKKVLIDDIADVVNNHWPSPDFYMEDCGEVWSEPREGGLFKFGKDGQYVPINPGVMVELSHFDFAFAWQGGGEENRKGIPPSFVALFNKVMRAKSHVTMIVGIPKSEEAAFRIHVKGLKGYIQ